MTEEKLMAANGIKYEIRNLEIRVARLENYIEKNDVKVYTGDGIELSIKNSKELIKNEINELKVVIQKLQTQFNEL